MSPVWVLPFSCWKMVQKHLISYQYLKTEFYFSQQSFSEGLISQNPNQKMPTKFSLRFKLNQIQALNPSHGSSSNSGNSTWPHSQNFMLAKSRSKSHQPFPEIIFAFCSLCTSPPPNAGATTDHSSLTGRSLIFMNLYHFKGFTDLLYQLCL